MLRHALLLLAAGATLPSFAAAQAASTAVDISSDMRWRHIGPVRAGRARALAGVPSQPNVFYAGYDDGGVWRSTDYGSNWVPLFDKESTGSIGAIAVAPSHPNIIYVGSGAGIIRPDLAVGDGMYKSVDGGVTWTHLGLRNSQMIAMIDVDPTNPDRLFVAVLGHPYGPSTERGIFRSTDGGATFERVLYRDEYTSGNDLRIDPKNPNIVYATLWQQQQSFIEGQGFSGEGGIFKSMDGGTTWRQLKDGLPAVQQANIAISQGNPNVLYANIANVATATAPSTVVFYRTSDGGEHWHVAVQAPGMPSQAGRVTDSRPMGRIGGGDLPSLAIDPKNENVVYSASTVMWRTEDAGYSWSAVRGAPGGDDYQKIWINPNDPNIVFTVTDQGAVVSGNRGVSWSNWYTQPTAAMYHVTTDNAFPYRVCSGQQDSGSACVPSRSDDGQITFHDWHPVNIQEYGVAAPDPRDPDVVFGSMRSGVSRYDRRTGQTTYVGPDMEGFSRNVRTMPLHFSPANPDVLYYASNAVWKSLDRGRSWTRISPDLTRQTWEVPTSAGQYASGVKVSPAGSLTALAPSPRDVNVLWSGSDDGTLQVTRNGGASWTNVTPPMVKPWARIYNLEAGHFDTQTAYAAVNTLRLDDMNPHFIRTHDGGRTWTEINTGIAGGAASNSIREDPRQKGVLYAGTDRQVWVSYDDGDHWESLRLNMPAIAVRDVQVKDDSTCHCADLVVGTHGRGFWILDNISTLRQAVAARTTSSPAHLFKPPAALRVRFGGNDPTPWPAEMPAGENPMPGGIIDYTLGAAATGLVTLVILDAAGTVVRHYSSADPVLDPDPARDPAAYNRICQANPTATHCGLPLYWPAPAMRLGTTAGMHRFAWDLHFDPIAALDITDNGTVEAKGAVPRRTYPVVDAPWAPPGQYTVRLTVNGSRYTQPLTLRLDPRVKTPPAALRQLATLSREMWVGALAANAAQEQARAWLATLSGVQGTAVERVRKELETLAPARQPRARFRRPAANTPPSLTTASAALMAAAMAMQGADVPPTQAQVAACTAARTMAATAMTAWSQLRQRGLASINAERQAAGQPVLTLPTSPAR